MARADLPTLHIRAVRHDPVPPQRRDVMYLIVERVPFEGPHQCALPRRIGLVQHFLIEIDRRRVVKVAVLLGEDRGGLILANVEQRVDDALAITFERHFEIAATQRLEPRAGRRDPLVDLKPDLAPLIDQPGAEVFEGLIDIAVQKLETEPFCARVLQQPPRLGARFLDIGQKPASCSGSSLVAAKGEPGNTMPPTVRMIAIFDKAGAPCQRSTARVSARRTRTSSNGFFLWFGVTSRPQFQSLVCTVILSPSAPTNSSRAAGGRPRNSIAARSLRIASRRVACFGARIPTMPSRYGSPLW